MKKTPGVGGWFVQRCAHASRQFAAIGAMLVFAISAHAQTLAVGTVAGTVSTSTPFSNTTPVTFNNPYGIAADSNGNAYIADTSNHVIRKISAAGVVSTLAGSPGSAGFVNDATAGAPAARFSAPRGITINAAGTTLYVADTANHAIRVITLSAIGGSVTGVSTLAGTGSSGSLDSGAASTFNGPRGIAINNAGDTLYVADTFNHTIRSIVIAGPTVSTVAGLAGTPGTANGDNTTARFDAPWGIAVNTAGTALFVADFNNHAIRRIALSPAVAVTTYAGTIGTAGFTNNATGTSALLRNPAGLANDGSDNLYVGEFGNNALRLIAAATGNAVSTVAGGSTGSADGSGSAAQFNGLTGVAARTVSSTLFVFIADTNNQLIRKAAPPAAASVGSPSNQGVLVGATATFTATVTGGWPTPTLQWYRQPGGTGTFQALTASATYSGVTTQTLTITNVTAAMNNDKFKLVATNASGAPESSVATLTVNQPPVYNPTTVTFQATVGQPATFSAAVQSGTTPVTYAVTSGSLAPFQLNTSTGAITGTPSSTADSVSGVVITASNGFAPNATLNVAINVTLTSAPVITTQPSNQTVAADKAGSAATASFTVAATGTPSTFTYKWQRQVAGSGPFVDLTNDGTYSGVTTATLSLTGVTPAMNGDQFHVIVSNGVSPDATSTAALLTVQGVVANVTTSPSSTSAAVGANASFTAVVAGNPTPTVKWQRAPVGSSTFSDLTEGAPYTGTTGLTLTVSAVTAAMNGDQFKLVATNIHGTATSSSATLAVTSSSPTFSAQPQNTSVNAGANATFTAAAIGDPAPTLKWQRQLNGSSGFVDLNDDSTFSGTTTGTLTITAVTPGMNGDQFRLKATNTNGENVSSAAALTVVTNVPTISTQPVDVTASVGQNVTFTAAATGSPTPTVRWQRQQSGTSGFVDLTDDGTYSGTTTNTLTVSGVTLLMSGDQFRLVATNASGSTPSNTAKIIVNLGINFTTYAGVAGVSGSADGAGSAARFYTPTGVAVGSDGRVYIADTANHVIRRISVNGVVETLAGKVGVTGSVDGAAADARFNSPQGVAVDSIGNVYVADTFNHTIRIIGSSGVVTTLAGSANLSGTADGVGSAARFFLPSGIVYDSSTGSVYVADSSNHAIRRIQSSGAVTTIAGAIGVAGFINNSGTAARFNFPTGLALDSSGNLYVADSLNHSIRKIVASTLAVTTLAGTGSPGATDANGTAASFSRPNGVAVDSSGNVFVADTASDLIRKITPAGDVTTIAGVAGSPGSADGAGSSARFNQPFGIALDSSANIYVTDTQNHTIRRSGSAFPPSITAQPTSKLAAIGGTVTFVVTATGTPPPSYQWQRATSDNPDLFTNLTNDGTFSGVNTSQLVIVGATSAMNGMRFRVIVNNGVGAALTSDIATLTIGTPPTFTSSGSATFRAGESGVFTVTVSSSTPATFSLSDNPSWMSINSSTGVISGTPPDTSGSPFNVTVTANNGVSATQTVTVTVLPAQVGPSFVSQPVSATVNQGDNVSFSVSVSGTEPFTYQWRRNGVAIPGATSPTLTLSNVQPSSVALYSVAVTNVVRTEVSAAATLTVNTAPVFAAQPHAQVAVAGSSVTFTSLVTGGNLTYQWRKNGVAIPGANGSSYTLPSVSAADAGNYDVFVSNALGTIGSSLAQLTIVTAPTAPVITAQPAARTALIGSTITISAAASGAPAPSYQWRKNGANINGATNATLTLSPVQSGDAANYDVVISNTVGTVTSNPAGLRVIARSYAGVYFGSLAGVGDFALYIRDDNTGVFLAYALNALSPIVSLNVSVSDNGAFSFTQSAVASDAGVSVADEPARAAALAPVIVVGGIGTDGTVTGTVTGGASATLAGSRTPDGGATQAYAGYYQGGATANAATVYTIASADNRAFAVVQTATGSDGGRGTITSSGAVSVVASRSVITESLSTSGTLSGTSTGGVTATFNGGSDAALARQRLLNISSRARVASADSVAIAGFVISGEESKPVLIRAVGPTLSSFGVSGALASPRLELFRGSTSLAVNTGIGTNRAAIDAAGVQAGAFALGSSGADAAILTTLAPGNYTAVVSSTNTNAGVALVEVYDLSAAAPGQKLLNISTRAAAGTAENTLTAGFVVPPGPAKRVLVRGIGPGLTPFGVTGVLAQPILTVLNGSTTVATNTNWRTSADQADITTASAQVGGFGLATNDSAVLVTLPAGNYTAQVVGTGGTTGVALIEVYEVP